MGRDQKRKRQRVGWVVLLLIVPGLAFPLLSRCRSLARAPQPAPAPSH